ncbi:MAG: hypothetical protein ACYC03_10535, partial [Acidovorax defluvii]
MPTQHSCDFVVINAWAHDSSSPLAFRIPHLAAHMRWCVITLTVSSAWPGAPALCAHPWHKAKKPRTFRLWAFAINGRRGGIRTRDPLHPIEIYVKSCG